MARLVTDRQDVIPALAEVFRTHGYEGASLAAITAATGLGKGSLYNFFPGGKAEMAEAVLAHIDAWFEAEVFAPLRRDGAAAIAATLDAVDRYFQSGRRVCVVGVFALGEARDRFARRVHGYFAAWVDALAGALTAAGLPPDDALDLAREVVEGIQGALVLARALDDPGLFGRALVRLRGRLGVARTRTGPEPL